MPSTEEPQTPSGTQKGYEVMKEKGYVIEPMSPPLSALGAVLVSYMGKKSIATDVLAELIGLNRSTLYRILRGQRRPSRDTTIALGLALEIGFRNTQDLLKVARVAQLTSSNARDHELIYALSQRYSVGHANDWLHQRGHDALRSSE